MNKLVNAFALASAATACQQKPAATFTITAQTKLVPVASPDSTTWSEFAAAEAKKCDLSRLWAGGASMYRQAVLDGFFGPEYRRIGFAFTDIQRDAQRPMLYHVKGKNLYNKVVSAFSGTITVTSLAHLDQRKLAEDEMLEIGPENQLYSAAAKFDFQEDSTVSTAGRFSGMAHLDFSIEKGKPQVFTGQGFKIDTPAQGTGVLYKGQWVGYGSTQAKLLLLSGNALVLAPEALTDFSIGDRGATFNPKYAKLGWNSYWQNDEWWTTTPKEQHSPVIVLDTSIVREADIVASSE